MERTIIIKNSLDDLKCIINGWSNDVGLCQLNEYNNNDSFNEMLKEIILDLVDISMMIENDDFDFDKAVCSNALNVAINLLSAIRKV